MLPHKKKYAYRKTPNPFKDTIIHLHGSKGDSQNMAPIMKRLEDKAQIIAIDMRGFGQTTYDRPVQSHKELAIDVMLLLREKFPELMEYYVFGYDIGATVAMELGALDSERV